MGLTIRLLGPFEVWRTGDEKIEHWRTSKNRELLKLLASDAGTVFSVDTLIERLWPEADPDRARRNLRGRVSELRRILEPDLARGEASSYLETASGRYRLRAEACWIDAVAFRDWADRGRQLEAEDSREAIRAYEQAAALYRGDLLAEDPHLEWAVEPRRQLRRRMIELCGRLVELLVEAGRGSDAVAYGERARALDPRDEPTVRALMRAYEATAQPAEALRVYERFRARLAEIGAAPAAETDQLHERIHRQRADVPCRLDAPEPGPEELAPEPDADTPRDRARLYRQRAEQCRNRGELAHAHAEAEAALAAAQASGDAREAARALGLCAALELDRRDPETAESLLHEAFERLQAAPSDDPQDVSAVRLQLLLVQTRLATHRHAPTDALAAYEQAYRLAEQLDDTHAEARLLLNIGNLYYAEGHLAEAKLHWQRARELGRQIGRRRTEAKALNNLALLRNHEGDLEEALTLYRRIVTLAEQAGDQGSLADAWNNLGMTYDVLGQHEHAIDAYERARELSQAIGDRVGMAIEVMNRGGVRIVQGRYEEAEADLAWAQACFAEHAAPRWQVEAAYRRGWLERERGRPHEALRQLDAVRDSAEALDVTRLRAVFASHRAVTLRDLGRLEEARQEAEAAHALLDEGSTFHGRIGIGYRLSLVYRDLDRPEPARGELRRAHDVLQEIARNLATPAFLRSFMAVPLHRRVQAAWETPGDAAG